MLGLGKHTTADLATVIFSSGSTGEPKGVMLTHGDIAANVESMIQAVTFGPKDRLLGVLPLFHSFGYTVTLWAPLQIGASSVYHADPRQAKEIGDLCKSQKCTIYVSTATFLRFMLRKCEPDDLKTLRILICGAEKLPQSVAQDFEKKFGVLPLEGYGCTELSPVAATNLPDKVIEGFRQVMNKPGTVGQPIPGVAARVVEPDTMRPLPVGSEGLLLIYGANVMKGYLGKPELTAQVVRDGWYVTGDMAKIDDDGFITLTGRLSRFAKIGGEMVPLERVEEELHEVLCTSERIGGGDVRPGRVARRAAGGAVRGEAAGGPRPRRGEVAAGPGGPRPAEPVGAVAARLLRRAGTAAFGERQTRFEAAEGDGPGVGEEVGRRRRPTPDAPRLRHGRDEPLRSDLWTGKRIGRIRTEITSSGRATMRERFAPAPSRAAPAAGVSAS